MSIEINIYAERKRGGKWVSCDEWEDGKVVEKKRLYSGLRFRNWCLFAMLTKEYGGHQGIESIAGFREIPDNVSPEVRQIYESYHKDWDLRAESWVTLKELLEFDWTQNDENGHPYYRLVPEFLSEVIPQLLHMGKPKDVRIICFLNG